MKQQDCKGSLLKLSYFNLGPKGEKGQDGKSGVKYVRWGRTTCPSGADIVYKGKDWFITKNC